MQLGAFSISLSVKDIAASRAFYEKFGFQAFGGNQDENWLMLKNGDKEIGIFTGMLEGTLLTFNPGWDQSANPVQPFTDVRQIKRHLKEQGIELSPEADETTTGPGYFITIDPDGNAILVDQHV